MLRDEPLPRLRAGRDWLAFSRMGAYTLAGASAFNGFDAIKTGLLVQVEKCVTERMEPGWKAPSPWL